MKKGLLFLFTFLYTMVLFAQKLECSDLFISEYVEGPSNDNAIEIYNPTNVVIDLNEYTIKRYSNGDNNPAVADVWQLSGTIDPGKAIAIGNGQVDSFWVTSGAYWSLPTSLAFRASCDFFGSGVYPTPFYFNGDDAITLEKNNVPIDIFGKVGEDPGSAWTDDANANPPFTDGNGGDWWTKRKTLIRKASVKTGVTMNPVEFDPTLEYDSLPDGDYSNLGFHICDCIAQTDVNNKKPIDYVIYPNPTNKGDLIYIHAEESINSLEVFNVLGSKEKAITNPKSPYYFSTSNMKKGIYFLRLYFKNGEVSDKKIVVN